MHFGKRDCGSRQHRFREIGFRPLGSKARKQYRYGLTGPTEAQQGENKPLILKTNRALARREFLRFAGLGALGLTLSEVSFARGLGVKPTGELLVYVGTYTTGKSEGIYLCRLNLASGELKHINTTKGVINPSFLALSPSRRYLYAVNEVQEFAGKKSG